MIVEVIFGATATGKTARAIALATQSGAAIINADAMQCYDALPILSAQPTLAEQSGIPHYLLGCFNPACRLTAAGWAAQADAIIKACHARNQPVIVVGGTGLYLKALMEGLSPIPPVPDAIREAVEQVPLADAWAELKLIDPVLAERLNANDAQRIRRAVAVFRATQTPLSTWQNIPAAPPPYAFRKTLIQVLDRAKHQNLIRARLHTMVAQGAVEDVIRLQNQIASGAVPPTALVTKTIGYHTIVRHLAGEISIDAAIDLATIQSSQYAKRQATWGRGQFTPDTVIAVF